MKERVEFRRGGEQGEGKEVGGTEGVKLFLCYVIEWYG